MQNLFPENKEPVDKIMKIMLMKMIKLNYHNDILFFECLHV